jgi:hypothetical protein
VLVPETTVPDRPPRRITVLGAGGTTGRAVLAATLAHEHVAITAARRGGPDVDRRALTVAVDATDRAGLERLCDASDVLVAAVPDIHLEAVVAAAARHRTHVVTVTADPALLAAVEGLVRGTSTAVLAAGYAGIGAILATTSLAAVMGEHVHVAHAFPDGRLTPWSPAVRAELARGFGAPMPAWRDARPVDEATGEVRRLAWFARPLGPHHAAAVAGLDALTVPLAHPAVREVRTYLAVGTMQAELLQAAATLTRWPPAARRIRRRIAGSGAPRDPEARWAIVAESAGPGGIARAWAYGRDPQTVGARLAGELAVRLAVEPPPDGGLLPIPTVARPADLLDRLSDTTSTRWQLKRPEPVMPAAG